MSDYYIMLKDKKFELSEETAKNMQEQFQKDQKPECFIGGDIKLGLVDSGTPYKTGIVATKWGGYNDIVIDGESNGGEDITVVPLADCELIGMRDKLNELIDYLKIVE